MSKVVTYMCDCCVIIYPFDELEAVQVYVFTPFNDPKQIDYEMVCPNCRQELLNLLNKWIGTKPFVQHGSDMEAEIEQSKREKRRDEESVSPTSSKATA